MKYAMKHKVGGRCEVDGCGREHYGRGLCKKHHQAKWKRGELPSAHINMRQKLHAYSVPIPESGCWLWTRSTNDKGYGVVSIGKQKKDYAHRAAYREFNGDIPAGVEVCHKCDTPSCINPEHLFLGTHWENMADAKAKGRMRCNPLRGTNSPNARLSSDQVLAIRQSSKPATYWARRHGVSAHAIRRAKTGLSYRDVPRSEGSA